MVGDGQHEVTRLLTLARDGDASAVEQLIPLVYEDLRARAAVQLQGERTGHTLQPTALAHEAYLRLVHQGNARWNDRAHFLGIASICIRRILIDHARARGAAKRPPESRRIDLERVDLGADDNAVELLALDEALSRLAEIDARKARVIELRYFGGLTNAEIGRVVATSEPTVERDLRMARAWLHRRLADDDTNAPA